MYFRLTTILFLLASICCSTTQWRAAASNIFEIPGESSHGLLNAGENVTQRFDTPGHTPPLCSLRTKNGVEYCLFTSPHFANGRGISVIGSVEQGKKLFELPAFTDPGAHSALGANRFTTPPFFAKEMEGRGIGLIANRTIKRGEWLMSFTPAYMISEEAYTELSLYDRLYFQRLAFERLPSRVRDLSYNLYGQEGENAVDFIDDVLDTNTFALPVETIRRIINDEEDDDDDDDDDENSEIDFRVLFPEIARFNHACRPTASYFFDTATLTQHIIAYRDVFPGEELTITYIDPLQKHRARQKALHRSWGFTCDCLMCDASPEKVKQSDARVGEIWELQEELDDLSRESTGSPLMAERMISLMRQEHLWTLLHEGYAAAALEYSRVGDAAKARENAEIALKGGHICRGTYHVDEEYSDLLWLKNDPQSHPSWKARVRWEQGTLDLR